MWYVHFDVDLVPSDSILFKAKSTQTMLSVSHSSGRGSIIPTVPGGGGTQVISGCLLSRVSSCSLSFPLSFSHLHLSPFPTSSHPTPGTLKPSSEGLGPCFPSTLHLSSWLWQVSTDPPVQSHGLSMLTVLWFNQTGPLVLSGILPTTFPCPH